MSSTAHFPTDRRRAPEPRRDFDQYFTISLYLLVLSAFVALVVSGGVGLVAAVLAGTAFVVRGLQFVRRDPTLLSERWTTLAAIAYFAFFVADYFFLSRSFLPPVVHLVLFAVLIRLFTLRRERDFVTLAVLAFLMILAAAIFTVDSLFLLCFALFLLLAVVTFVLMEMRHSQRSSVFPANTSASDIRRLPALLARLGPAIMLLVLLTSAGIFFLLPRRSAGYLGAYSFGSDLSTGFSDKVQLGQIGRIQQSDAVAMHIQIEGDTSGSHDLYWRGISLSQFDGTNWSNPDRISGQPIGASLGATFDIPGYGSSRSSLIPGPARMIHYRVLLEPIGTNVFFTAPWIKRIKGPYRGVFVGRDGTVSNVDADGISRYEADSDLSAPSVEKLRFTDTSGGVPISPLYLQLPALDPRIPILAASITQSASSSYDKAAQLQDYLRTHYGYTLQLPTQPVKDPVANFLFERRQGHCEYFASSMAVMLRSLGIPSRVVNGFHGGEFNQITSDYIVRARDAHSWVEAYFPGEGWVTFDPTPAGSSGTHSLGRIALYLDAMSSFWREWVVSYDRSHQLVLGQTALQNGQNRWQELRRWSRHQYQAMLFWAKRFQQNTLWSQAGASGFVASSSKTAGMIVGPLLLLMFAGIPGWMVWQRTRQRRIARDPSHAAAVWYTQMTRTLARRGHPKPATLTAQEFALAIPDRRLQALVTDFTDTYLAARFGLSADDARKLPELLQAIKHTARA